ncbi:MAG: penicillin-binding protein 2 [Alphaproteobacteria bacterium]|nr:penicillin-binding protein 2 [Alphaproteobacteria bacterium]
MKFSIWKKTEERAAGKSGRPILVSGGGLQLEGETKTAIEIGRTRLLLGVAIFLLAFGGIGVRLVDVTVIDPEQRVRPLSAPAQPSEVRMERADILDRNGLILATSLPTMSLFAHPKDIRDAKAAAAGIHRILPELTEADVLSKLTSERNFVYIKRNLTPRERYEINRLGQPGLDFESSERRVYPQGALAAHVVGLSDLDNKGIAGIEKTFDETLRQGSTSVRLSLDLRVQHILRSELALAMSKSSAIGATGMVMDVQTGELLAMVSLPDFDPNLPATQSAEAMFNRATLGSYEMGSTFKLFTAAAALDSGVANMGSTYDAREPIKIARYEIKDYHPMHKFLSIEEIMIHSSNIGAARMALDLGTAGQKAFMGRIGMLKPIRLELPEMGAPQVPQTWREINTMTIAYGHGLSVTPLHLAAGVATLVNGGLAVPATLMKREAGQDIEALRVLSAKTSDAMRKLMRAVVESGTGSKADTNGYDVGGKTGTAEKLSIHGGYAKKALLSSFVGAFPINNPRFVVLAMIDEPKGTKETFGFATGGWVAAPVVSRVVAQVGPLLGIEPSHEPAAGGQGRQAGWSTGVRKVATN